MTDTAAAPAIEAPADAPAEAPAPKAAPLFRRGASEDDGAGRALKEGREKVAKALAPETGAAPDRDPKTGKFLGKEEAPAQKREDKPAEGTLAPDFAAREEAEKKAAEPPPAEPPAKGDFSFEFNGKAYDKDGLERLLRTMDTRTRSAQQLSARLQTVLDRIQAGDVPPAVAKEVEKDGAKTALTEGPKNPFESEFVDQTTPEQAALWDKVQQDLESGDIRLAMARLFNAFEGRVKAAMSYRDHTRAESLAGVNSYFGALGQIHAIGTFFKAQFDRVDDATGEPLFPIGKGRQGKEQIAALTNFLHRHRLERTQENFELAYDAVIRRGATQPKSGAASTPRRVEADTEDHSPAASAAAALALRSAGAPPSPREESRPLSMVEQLREEARRPNKALFKGSRG